MVRFIIAISLLAFIGLLAPFIFKDSNDGLPVQEVIDPETTVHSQDSELKRTLSAELFNVARRGGTEQPFSGAYNTFFEPGVYECSVCGNELFSSESKFDSRTGWPSFDRPIYKTSLTEQIKKTGDVAITEVKCSRCESHIGFVYQDGPKETTGLRYCINSISLQHKPRVPH